MNVNVRGLFLAGGGEDLEPGGKLAEVIDKYIAGASGLLAAMKIPPSLPLIYPLKRGQSPICCAVFRIARQLEWQKRLPF